MASDTTVNALLGQQVDDLYNDNRPNGTGGHIIPVTQIGDGLHGPRTVERLQIRRDPIPIAADELGFQASLGMEVHARSVAGRAFVINPDMTPAGGGLSDELPGLPLQGGQRPSRFVAGQTARGHTGVSGPQVLPPARTVYYTATPYVGYGATSGDW